MKFLLKNILNRLCQLISLPLIILCKLENLLISRDVDAVFNTCAHFLALFPGLPGVFLRRGFYSLTLEKCSLNCHIGFGSIFSHRSTIVEEHVYIGNYCLIGSCIICENTLLASRVSILSGGRLHELDKNGKWTPYTAEKLKKIEINRNVWIGEGAIVMANIGEGSLVGAGSVVTSIIGPNIVSAGNPSRYIRDLQT